MTAADWLRLVLLAAIWGGAFPFMRVAAPVFGPAWSASFGEALPASALACGVLILVGTILVTRS